MKLEIFFLLLLEHQQNIRKKRLQLTVNFSLNFKTYLVDKKNTYTEGSTLFFYFIIVHVLNLYKQYTYFVS